MGRKDGDANILGNTYSAIWKIKITAVDKSRLRWVYSIPFSIKLRFDNEDKGVVVHAKENEVCVYEDMFEAGFRLPFSRVVRELLHYLHVAPHQLAPNAWRIFFACVGTAAESSRRREWSHGQRIPEDLQTCKEPECQLYYQLPRSTKS